MRNRLIHAYFDVDLDVVWKTLTDDLSELIEELEKRPPPSAGEPIAFPSHVLPWVAEDPYPYDPNDQAAGDFDEPV